VAGEAITAAESWWRCPRTKSTSVASPRLPRQRSQHTRGSQINAATLSKSAEVQSNAMSPKLHRHAASTWRARLLEREHILETHAESVPQRLKTPRPSFSAEDPPNPCISIIMTSPCRGRLHSSSKAARRKQPQATRSHLQLSENSCEKSGSTAVDQAALSSWKSWNEKHGGSPLSCELLRTVSCDRGKVENETKSSRLFPDTPT